MLILPRESPTPLPMCAGPWLDSARAPAEVNYCERLAPP
jgi:hypothetical protein